MTDDGFVFGDDSDEEALFGTRSDDDATAATETDHRFGTPETDDTDSRRLTQRIRAAISDTTSRGAMAALALACVVVLGLVAYPLVMGALDTGDGPADSGADGSVGVGGTLTTTARTTGATGTTETATATTNAPTATQTTGTSATASPTTKATPTPTPTPVPTRGFPAGTPAETNETTDGNAQSAA